MTTATLQDFAASVTARGQITFGDVRRLQRDCLPGGITTREQAEILIALSDKLVRADKAWAQWLVAALARYLGSGSSSEDSRQEWPYSLLAASPATTALGRRIARTIRRELSKLVAAGTESAPQLPADEPRPVRVETCPAPSARLINAIARSDIVARPHAARVARRKRKTALPPVLPVEVWSARMMEKHQRFQLERPCL
jgi:hypothetical protein